MAVVVKNIIPRKHAEGTQTTQYTASGCTTIIDKFTITNNGASNASLSVNLIPQSGSASNANRVVAERFVAPGESYTCPELVGQVLAPGGFISTLASAATTLTISASGREIT